MSKIDSLALPLPELNSIWEHHSGRQYKVMYIANEPNTAHYPTTIVYRGGDGRIWTRPAADWFRSMVLIK